MLAGRVRPAPSASRAGQAATARRAPRIGAAPVGARRAPGATPGRRTILRIAAEAGNGAWEGGAPRSRRPRAAAPGSRPRRAVWVPHWAARGRQGGRAAPTSPRLPRPPGAAAASSSAAPGSPANPRALVVVGSGPAGYTAAIYAARANLSPLVVEGFRAGGVRGGQLMTTTEVENFPGFPDGVTGPDLMDRMRAQAERWGAELVTDDVESVDLSSRPFSVTVADGATVHAHAIIVATGATAKRLGIPSEKKFWSAGISACAICDGASPLFAQQPVAVVGGGDTAVEEALYLTKYASHVHLLVRSDKLRASAAMAARVEAHPRVTVHYSTAIADAVGDSRGAMAALALVDAATGAPKRPPTLPVRGLFYGIGHTPNTGVLGGQVETDAAGYIKLTHGPSTSVDGVFAAGDVADTEWRQAVTAAGSGCQAALAAERWLAAKGLLPEPGAAAAAPATAPGERAKEAATAANAAVSPDDIDVAQDVHQGQAALRKLYHESPRPLLVLYSAPSCGPCRMLKPVLRSVAAEYAGRVHLVEVDIEADPEIAKAAGVGGTPTLHLFHRKALVVDMPGVKNKRDYRAALDGVLEGEGGEAAAAAAAAADDRQVAAK